MTGLVYHAHLRPLTTPLAALLDISATLHQSAPPTLPTPASILRALSSSSFAPEESRDTGVAGIPASIANALTIPPIHVEHVAKAVVHAIEDETVEGVVGVRRMRGMLGFEDSVNGEREDRERRAEAEKAL